MRKYFAVGFILLNACLALKEDEKCASKEEMCNKSNNVVEHNKYSEGKS